MKMTPSPNKMGSTRHQQKIKGDGGGGDEWEEEFLKSALVE